MAASRPRRTDGRTRGRSQASSAGGRVGDRKHQGGIREDPGEQDGGLVGLQGVPEGGSASSTTGAASLQE
jgi:hypothetical protein